MDRNLIIPILIMSIFVFCKNGIGQVNFQRNVKFSKGDLLQYQLGDIKDSLLIRHFGNEFEGEIIDFLSQESDTFYTNWIRHYPQELQSGSNIAEDIAIDLYGNIYVTGTSFNSITGYDYVTIKYNSSGEIQWISRYSHNGSDMVSDMEVDNYCNIYVTGSSWDSSTGSDYTTIKYSPSGEIIWIARYNGLGNDYDQAHSLVVSSSGSVYVTGVSRGLGTDYDFATVKYDSNGKQVWIARYNGSGNSFDEAKFVLVDSLDNVYVTGTSVGLETSSDITTIKYNSAGEIVWVARYNSQPAGYYWENSSELKIDSYGNVYVTGYGGFPNTYNDSYYITIKYNSIGELVWVAKYNGPGIGWDEATSITLDNLGNVYVTGRSQGLGTSYDITTIKYNLLGNQEWIIRYNGPGNSDDYATAISLDNSGNIFVIGNSYGSGAIIPNLDFVTLKYDASGVQKWIARYNYLNFSDDYTRSLFIDNLGNIYVTGSSGFGNNSIYTTIKYTQVTVSVDEQNELFPNQYSLSQNYPNPFNPVTTIKYQLPVNSKVTLKIYNIFGQEVKTLVDDIQEAGYKSVEWNSTNNAGNIVSSGVYFYRIEATSVSDPSKKFSQLKKMLLIK